MKIIVIAGFLGSGKTSLLLALARRAIELNGCRVAIIENEIGKIGVDGQTIQSEGFAVRELFSGCVCCTLRLDLVNTLLALEREVKPDVVFVEPSGVAGPDMVADSLDGYGGEIDAMALVVLLDATRRSLILRKPTLPVIERGLLAANLLLINKVDAVPVDEVAILVDEMRLFRSGLPIVQMSALTGENVAVAADAIAEILSADARRRAEEVVIPLREPVAVKEDTGPVPAVFAERRSFVLRRALASENVVKTVSSLLASMAVDATVPGVEFAGHIKAALRDEGGPGYLTASVTKLGKAPDLKGRLRPEIERFSLTVNAIAYGIDPIRLGVQARRRLAEFCFD